MQLFGLLACYGEQLVGRALLARCRPAALAALLLGWPVAKGGGAISCQAQMVASLLGRVVLVVFNS